MKHSKFFYFLIFIGTVLLDRATKCFALTTAEHGPFNIFPGFSINLMLNRGISWGMFSRSQHLGFYLVAASVMAVIICFTAYTIMEYRRAQPIFLQLMVLGGACSNFFDRFWYGGVIDFIDFYYGAWHWPSFNIADVAIVLGIFFIMGKMFYGNESKP